MDEMEYPKVLVIGHGFNMGSGGGITLTNLFKNWPKEKIAVAASQYYYCLSTHETRGNFYILDNLKHPFSGRGEKGTHPLGCARQENRYVNVVTRIVKSAVRKFCVLLGCEPLLCSADFPGDFYAWVRKFDPDIIYTQPASIHLIKRVMRLAEYLRKPIVIHMMDDWPRIMYQKGPFSVIFRKKMDRLFLEILERAKVLLAISEKMRKEYSVRYGKEFTVFHNPVDIDTWLPFSKMSYGICGPMKVLYAGRIGWSTYDSLCEIAKAIDSLIGEEYKIEFHVVATTTSDTRLSKRLEQCGCVSVDPAIPYQECPREFARFDLLVLANDFNESSRRFARLSISTKTSEYMITGVPILVYAPRDFALLEYACDQGWAYGVSEHDTMKLKEALSTLYHDAGLREKLGTNARQIAIKEHDALKVREKFRKALCRANI